MKAFVCCVLFAAAALAAPEAGVRDKRGLLATGVISPYGLGLGYGGLPYGGLGLGYGGLGYGGLGYGGLGYGGLGLAGLGYGHHLPVLATPVLAVSKKVVEEPNKVVSEKKLIVPEVHVAHAIPALPVHGLPYGLHGVPAYPHALW